MSDYISGEELISFTNITALAAESEETLEANIIPRSKRILDSHCHRDFESMDEDSEDYEDIQLAQKLIAERLYIKDNQDVKMARTIIGKGGSEKKGDWNYSLGEDEPIVNKEIADILKDHVDWTKVKRPVTGKMSLKGDPSYDSQVNSNIQNQI